MSRKTRKLIWSAPLVAVLAVVGVLAMFAAQPTGSAQADHIGLPGAPTNVTAEAAEIDGHETIILSWDAPDDDGGSAITGYRIDYLDNASGRIWQQLTAMTTATEYADNHELEAESSRAYRVFAMNALGTGPTSAVAYGETAAAPDPAADAPGQVTVFGTPAQDGPTKLRLSWNAPADPGSSPITSYRIHFANTATDIPVSDGTESVTEADDVDDDLDFATDTAGVIDTGSDATTYTLTGLRARQTWHFVIYARNDTGNSATGSPRRNQTTTDPINPAPPTGLRAVSTAVDATESNTINLYWYWPTDDGGAPIRNFRVEVRKSDKSWPTAAETLATDSAGLNTALSATDGNGAIGVALPDGTNAYDWQHDASAGDDAVTGTLEYRVFTETDTGPDRRSIPSNMATETVNAGNSFPAPGAPTLTAGASTEGQLSLEWTAPTGYTGTGYRLDIAEGGTGTPQWKRVEANTIFADLPYVHENLAAGSYRYRVSAKPDHRALAAISAGLTVTVPTPPTPTAPGAPQNLTVDVVNAGQIDLSWEKPADDGGSEITGYRVHIDTAQGDLSNTTAVTSPEVTDFETVTEAVFDAKKELKFSVKGLRAQQTWIVAVTAHNVTDSTTDPITVGNSPLSDTAIVTMPIFNPPDMPVGLVAESAVDTNLRGVTKQGVLLLWNAPEAPAGAEITAYEVQRSVNDEDPAAIFTLTETPDSTATNPPQRTLSTYGTDAESPAEDEVRVYQVRTVAQAVSGENQEQLKSGWVMVRYPADTMMTPGAPVLSAMKDADMPASQINLTWTGPDNADRDVTGYIIERAYGDVMFLDADDGVAHPDFAFSNHMEWWETLNCAGMLKAVGSDADPTMDSDDKAMYCAHYDMTPPSNTAGTIMAGSEVDMEIEEYFNKRYEVITDATAMSHTDTGLMDNTEYSYRIRAVHGMDAGMWSNTAMAMTDSANSDPMAVGSIAPVSVMAGMMSDAMDVSMYFSDADGDMLTYTAMSSNNMIAMSTLSGSMLTIEGMMEGTATITVTASDGMGGMDAMQTIMVTVTPGMLTAPTDVTAMVDDSDPGNAMVTVTWMDGANADRHVVILFDSNLQTRADWIAGNQTDMTTTFSNVPSGVYTAVVVAVENGPTGNAMNIEYGTAMATVN